MGRRHWLAIDLGAGSGRLVLGGLDEEGRLFHEEVHRFQHRQIRAGGRWRWHFETIVTEIRRGLEGLVARPGFERASLASLGVDGWGVDYGLLDASGSLLEDPVCYRDPRTEGMLERLCERVPRERIYSKTGIQFLPFNTLVQLYAQIELGEWPARAARLLLVPDLVHHALGGRAACERTNASTTQMLSLASGGWDTELVRAIGLPPDVLPEIVAGPIDLGPLEPALARSLGLAATRIVAPATHDTASAVAGTPLRPGWAYVSSGTWSLVGLELASPLADERAARANVTNETGLNGTTRLLKNVMGLWILERCRAEWAEHGLDVRLERLLAAFDPARPSPHRFDPDDQAFLAPPSMDAALRAALARYPDATSLDELALTRAILTSLALRYAAVLRELARLTGRPIEGLHIVGGGSQNHVLNQATANASGLPVLAGPTEATALGNLLAQAVADGRFADLASARSALAESFAPRRYEPVAHPVWSSLGMPS